MTPDINSLRESLSSGELIILSHKSHHNGAGRGIFVGVAALLHEDLASLMAIEGRGLLSIALDERTAFRLGLRTMECNSSHNSSRPEYLKSIEAASCNGTGISAADRALTIRTAGSQIATANDLVTPGHVMPIVIRKPFSLDETLISGAHQLINDLTPYDVITCCDILDEKGEVGTSAYCQSLAKKLDLPFVEIESIRSLLLKGKSTQFNRSMMHNNQEINSWVA